MEMMIIILILIALDILAGVVAAIEHGELSSAGLRKGLYHKFATMTLVGLSYVLQYAVVQVPGLPEELTAIYSGTCLFVIIMETTSILENLVKINPDLASNKLFSIFTAKINTDTDGDQNV